MASPPTNAMFLFPAVPITDGLWDLATVSLIAGILILSILSLTFIFHLHLRSQILPHLGHFNSLWKVRLVLVLFAAFWALNELLRLPVFRQSYLYPNFPSLTVAAQTTVCKLHVVLSLGFYEPGFLVTLLFLVNVSIKKTERSRMWTIPSVCAVCFPMLLLQAFVVFFSPLQAMLPGFMHGSSVLSSDLLGRSAVLCTYPALSCIIFTVFAVAYALAFLVSCWQVVMFVINKTIGGRVYFLAVSVMVTLPIQIFCLGLTSIWLPVDPVYYCAVSTMFLSVLWCITVSEIILVIKPIADALDACGALLISPTHHGNNNKEDPTPLFHQQGSEDQ
nr:uncharacterized protein LOC104108309 [Ipomoea batatas]